MCERNAFYIQASCLYLETNYLRDSEQPAANITIYQVSLSQNARRGVRALLVGDWRLTGGVLKTARRLWEVGVVGWPVTGRRRGLGVLNITAAACTAGFHWWRSGNITRTQNVSEYMLVLALCLVTVCV